MLLFVATAAAAFDPPSSPIATCLTDGQVEDVLVNQGVEYLAGRFFHVRPPGTDLGDPEEEARTYFAACDAATGEVLPWDPLVECSGGNCATARGATLELAPGGTSIFLGGRFTTVAGVPHNHAVKVSLATAARDATFVPNPNSLVHRIVVAPDGQRVYLGGVFTQVGGCAPSPCHGLLAALSPSTGAIVPAFDPEIENLVGSFLAVYSIAVVPEGDTIYFGGEFEQVNGAPRSSVAAVDTATGQTNRAFAPRLEDADPTDPFPQVYDLRLDDRFVYVCGDWWSTETYGTEHDQRNVNRFDLASGALDEEFWIATDGGVQACDLDPGLGLLFVGGQFDCVRAWVNRTTPVDPNPAQCGVDALFVGTQQRDLFALRIHDGELVAWNPNTSGVGGTWAVNASPGRLDIGGELGWPFIPPASHQNLLAFELPLFADDFETENTDRWSSAAP